MLDCCSEDDFYAKLASLKDIWDEREKPFLGVNKEPCFSAFINEKVISHIVARPISHDYFVGTKPLVTNFCNLKSAQKDSISFLNIFSYDFNYLFYVNCIGTHDC